MELRKLSDREIQEMLDKQAAHKSKDLPQRDELDPHSRKQLRQYEALYAALATPAPVGLQSDFSEAVMARIRGEAPGRQFSWWQLILTVAGFVLGIGFALTYVGAELWTAVSTSISVTALASAIKSHISGLNISISLLASALIMFMFAIILDHFLSQSRHKLQFFSR